MSVSYLRCVNLIILGLALQACKRLDSQLGSLDNFAAGTVINRNMCSSSPERFAANVSKNFELEVDAKTDADILFQETMIALSAVPPALLDDFTKFNGKVIVSDTPEKYCGLGNTDAASRQFAAEGGASINSCFLLNMPNNPQSVQRMVVILGADVNVIRHATVRQFGYLYSQIFLRLQSVGKAVDTFVLSERANEYSKARDALARAFLIDVVDSGIFDLAALAPYLGDNVDQAVKKHLNGLRRGNDVELYNELSFAFGNAHGPKTKVERHRYVERFKDFVVAEAFDSYYCNAWSPYTNQPLNAARTSKNPEELAGITNTRQLMKELFRNTYREFAPMKTQLDGTAFALSDSKNTDNFALTANTSEEQSWAQWAGSTVQYLNSNYNPVTIVARKTGSGLDNTGYWLTNHGWSKTGKLMAMSGGFMNGVADSAESMAAGMVQTAVNPKEAYDGYYDETYGYSTNVIRNQQQSGSNYPIATGLGMSSAHILGPGQVHEGVRGKLYDGTVVSDPLDRIAIINSGVTKTATLPLAYTGGVQVGNRLAFKAGAPSLATKPLSKIGSSQPTAISPKIESVWGRPTAIDPTDIKPWEWADKQKGLIRPNPTIQELIPDNTGVAKPLKLNPNKNYIYAIVEDAKAPKGYKFRIAEEVPVGKVGDTFQGLGHPTLTADGARPLMGGDLNVSANGALEITNKSGRIVRGSLKTNPQRATPAALKTVVDDFSMNTGKKAASKWFDIATPKHADGTWKSPLVQKPKPGWSVLKPSTAAAGATAAGAAGTGSTKTSGKD